jgi:hypothetical protein
MFIFPLAGTDWNKIINIRMRKKLPQEALYNGPPPGGGGELAKYITPSNSDFLFSFPPEKGYKVCLRGMCLCPNGKH